MSVKETSGGRAAAYVFYNLPPVQMAIGLVRTIIAVYNIAKYYFYEAYYNEMNNLESQQRKSQLNQNENQRSQENLQAEKNTRNSTGLSKVGNLFKEGFTKLKNEFRQLEDDLQDQVEDLKSDLKNKAVINYAQSRRDAWKGQAKRGALELFLPIIASVGYTISDNKLCECSSTSKRSKKVSSLEFSELGNLIKEENEISRNFKSLVTGN